MLFTVNIILRPKVHCDFFFWKKKYPSRFVNIHVLAVNRLVTVIKGHDHEQTRSRFPFDSNFQSEYITNSYEKYKVIEGSNSFKQLS